MRLPHHPELFESVRTPSPEDPLRILISGCLVGLPVAVDGTDYGLGAALPGWLRSSSVRLVPFCPEDHGIGTPRTMPDLHGGDGFAVLDGRARVLDEHRRDLTEAMLSGARAMVERARRERVELCLLTDRSGACGSQVISLGCRFEPPLNHQKGVGVAAAALLRAGFHVLSQRDFLSLERLHARIDPSWTIDASRLDHHRHPWVLEHLAG